MIPAGTYVTLTFNALQGSFSGSPVLLNGTLRQDYLTTFDTNAATPAGLHLQLGFAGFSGTSEGGPMSELALYEFDSQGVRQGSSEKILPGFMMFFGSSALLMLRIIATAPGPASSSR